MVDESEINQLVWREDSSIDKSKVEFGNPIMIPTKSVLKLGLELDSKIAKQMQGIIKRLLE